MRVGRQEAVQKVSDDAVNTTEAAIRNQIRRLYNDPVPFYFGKCEQDDGDGAGTISQ